MKKLMIFGLILACCAAQKSPEAYRNDLLEMKQKLAQAQQKLLKQQAYIEQLKKDIARCEIALIQKEINQVDKHEFVKKVVSHEGWLAFFFQQRETLNQIIRNNPACRAEAQEVLDKILTLITQLSDQEYESTQ